MHISDGNVQVMASARSKVTAHGQISVPAEVRRKLGIGPGSVLARFVTRDDALLGTFDRTLGKLEGAERL